MHLLKISDELVTLTSRSEVKFFKDLVITEEGGNLAFSHLYHTYIYEQAEGRMLFVTEVLKELFGLLPLKWTHVIPPATSVAVLTRLWFGDFLCSSFSLLSLLSPRLFSGGWWGCGHVTLDVSSVVLKGRCAVSNLCVLLRTSETIPSRTTLCSLWHLSLRCADAKGRPQVIIVFSFVQHQVLMVLSFHPRF